MTCCFTVKRLANCAKLELVEGALGLFSADAKPVVVVFAANSGNGCLDAANALMGNRVGFRGAHLKRRPSFRSRLQILTVKWI